MIIISFYFFCHFPSDLNVSRLSFIIINANITLLFSPCGEVHAVVPHRQPNDVAVCAGLTLETDMLGPQVGVGWEGGYGSGSLLLLFPPPPSPPVSGGSDPVLLKVNSRIWSLASTAVGEKRNLTDWCNTWEPTQEAQRSLILPWYHVSSSLSLCLDLLPICIISFLSLSVYGKGPKSSLPSSSSPPPELQNKGPPNEQTIHLQFSFQPVIFYLNIMVFDDVCYPGSGHFTSIQISLQNKNDRNNL